MLQCNKLQLCNFFIFIYFSIFILLNLILPDVIKGHRCKQTSIIYIYIYIYYSAIINIGIWGHQSFPGGYSTV